jgi:hypothetical protein
MHGSGLDLDDDTFVGPEQRRLVHAPAFIVGTANHGSPARQLNRV